MTSELPFACSYDLPIVSYYLSALSPLLAITMRSQKPRRSARLTTYDSNGRDALADTVGWSRQKLESWITSPTVRPHLQLWYRVCIEGEGRFNDAIAWINTGERGYYYNPGDLEEDLLLACLGEGVASQEVVDDGEGSEYANDQVATSSWMTQELWARTAWRIVQNNRATHQAFGMTIDRHSVACYAFVIDLLCLAFHSIAFRGEASCYANLIKGTLLSEKLTWKQETVTFESRDHYESIGDGTSADDEYSTFEDNDTSITRGSDTPFHYKKRLHTGSTPASSLGSPQQKRPRRSDDTGATVVQRWLDDVARPCYSPQPVQFSKSTHTRSHRDMTGAGAGIQVSTAKIRVINNIQQAER